MDLQTAIERAISALKEQVFMRETVMIPKAEERGASLPLIEKLREELQLDNDALKALLEWKPEEKE